MFRVRTFAAFLGLPLFVSTPALSEEQAKPSREFVTAEIRSSDPCVIAEEILEPVNRIVGRVAAKSTPGELIVEIEERREGNAFGVFILLKLATGEAIGSRLLTSPTGTCEEIRERVILSVSLMIDLEREELAEKRAVIDRGAPFEGEVTLRNVHVEPER